MPDTTQPSIRLIVADLDGTLLNSNHEVPPGTERAVREAIERGVLFTVATGKTYPATCYAIEKFNITVPVVCANGTLIHDIDGTILYREAIPLDYALEAIAFAESEGMFPVVYSGSDLVAKRRDKNTDVLVAHHEPQPVVAPDLAVALRNHYSPDKLVFMNEDEPERSNDFHTQLAERFEGRAQVVRSGVASLVEFLPHDVTKGTALLVLLDWLGLTTAETITFGDNCNDLDMIRRAGIGVAMGQAPQAVREGADYVTATNDDDGVGLAIEKFVLASPQNLN